MADDEPQPLNYVQETVLKKRKNNEEWVIKKRERLAERKKSKESLKPAIKRPEEFVKEYRDKVSLRTWKAKLQWFYIFVLSVLVYQLDCLI